MARYSHIGDAIEKARKKRGLTQDQLAELVGSKGGRFTVIRWEAGINKPTEFVDQLVEVLGLEESLFEEDEAPFPGGRGARRVA